MKWWRERKREGEKRKGQDCEKDEKKLWGIELKRNEMIYLGDTWEIVILE